MPDSDADADASTDNHPDAGTFRNADTDGNAHDHADTRADHNTDSDTDGRTVRYANSDTIGSAEYYLAGPADDPERSDTGSSHQGRYMHSDADTGPGDNYVAHTDHHYQYQAGKR